MADEVRIWSFEHDAWWRAGAQGYTSNEQEAGLYARDQAERICSSANYGGALNEEIVELVQPPLKDQIAALIREINGQKNRATSSPYYFAVQSKRWVDTVHDGDKEVVAVDGHLYTYEEWEAIDDIDPEGTWRAAGPFWVREDWEDKAMFLTEKAALKFMQANAHHLTEPRTFVKHFWRNSEMEIVMRALEKFSGEKLAWK